MTNIVLVTGSARPNSVNRIMTDAVKTMLGTMQDVNVTVANLAEMNLPFFDTETTPSDDAFHTDHASVQRWSDMITAADGVVFIVPEYNHSLSAIQKNAIDWLYKEWKDKPAAFVGYGWYAAKHSHAAFLAVNDVIGLDLGEHFTGLKFIKDIKLDGTFIDKATVKAALETTLDELLAKTNASIPQLAGQAAV